MSKTPQKIGKYKVISKIGEGGMGAVYKAKHPTLARIVIIKKLTLTSNKDFIERFKREAQIMMDFRNENIVQVTDHFKEGNAYHIVMEFVDGVTLEELIRQRRFLSEEAAILIFSEICKALKYAHDRLVIHRDIKPANILICKHTGIVKLVDFGVSATLNATADHEITRAGMTIGTPSYLAPEQISNAKNRDKRTDIYSLGVMFYEMVIGKKPFRGGFTPEVIAQIEKGKYILPRKINPKISPSIQKIIKKSMHHNVRKRYQDLDVVLSKLSKRIKKYQNQSEINAAIKLYLEGKENVGGEKSKRGISGITSRVPAYLLALIVVGGLTTAGGYWAKKRGLIYEYLYENEMGAFRVNVTLGKGHKTSREIYLKATLFREKDNNLKKLKDVTLDPGKNGLIEGRPYLSFESGKNYVKEGNYVLLLYVENEQFRENFYLLPRIKQRQKRDSIDGRVLSFTTNNKRPALPVELKYEISDISTGKKVNQAVEISIRKADQWVSWTKPTSPNTPSNYFVSGKRYRFMFKSEDYFTRFYSITIRPEQTHVSLHIKMTPVPGELRIKSDSDNLQLLIDNAEYYVSGEKNRTYKRTNPIGRDYQKLYLSPGYHTLTVVDRKLIFNSTSASKELLFQSGKAINVFFDSKSNGQSSRFKINKQE